MLHTKFRRNRPLVPEKIFEGFLPYMSRVMKKTNVPVSDLVRHKLGCTAAEDG